MARKKLQADFERQKLEDTLKEECAEKLRAQRRIARRVEREA